MTQICRKRFRSNLKRTFLWRVTIFRRRLYSFWDQILACWIGKNVQYRQLLHPDNNNIFPPRRSSSSRRFINPSRPSLSAAPAAAEPDHLHLDSSDVVPLKISLLGDCRIGKTSFLVKYVGEEKRGEESAADRKGIIQMDKTLCVRGARISYSIWEVGGDAYCLDDNSRTPIPAACKDSVAILFMFDLTSRCTLNSVIRWYQQARKWNQTAILVMVGTKFDDFVQLPLDMQWTIASEARAYAKVLNATLFFSSASYNINVNKIFKFITAKLFNLPWDLERNLTIGEPIIDF